jgi:hypothetical protein
MGRQLIAGEFGRIEQPRLLRNNPRQPVIAQMLAQQAEGAAYLDDEHPNLDYS